MLTEESDKKLFLLDAYALIFRAYYAFIRNPRINSKGQNTSAVFGFTTAVLDILRNEKPTHIAIVFDPPGPTFRHEAYSEYKANRDETPEDIRASVPWIHEVAGSRGFRRSPFRDSKQTTPLAVWRPWRRKRGSMST